MKKISIIIPIYNSAPYLNRCLDSIKEQTYKNLEVLCIDDGSSDNSLEICEQYAANDLRFRVFKKEHFGGSGSPVRSLNIGIKHFKGDYIGFVDPDDWVELDMYEILYINVNRHSTAVGVVNFFWNEDGISCPETNDVHIPNEVLSNETMLRIMFARDIYRSFYFTTWNKLYNAHLLTKNNLTFNSNYTFAYDVLFNTELFLLNECTGIYDGRPLYHYQQRPDSIIHTPSTQMKRDDLRVFEKIILMLENKDIRMYDIIENVKRIHAFHAAKYVETSIADSKLFKEFQAKASLFADVYIDKNKNNKSRIEWFKKYLTY